MATIAATQRLRWLHLLSAGIFAVLAAAAGIFMKATSYPLVVGHATKDELASQNHTVFAPAVHALMSVDIRVVVIIILGLALITSLLAAVYWRKAYESGLQKRLSPLTWISLGGIVPAVMFETLALISGATDVLVLKVLAGVVILSAILCYMAERENKGARKPQWVNFYLAVAIFAVLGVFITARLIFTSVYGLVRLPWYVYGIYVVLAVISILSFVNLWAEITKRGKNKDFMVVERNYLLINLASKALFTLILIVGLKK